MLWAPVYSQVKSQKRKDNTYTMEPPIHAWTPLLPYLAVPYNASLILLTQNSTIVSNSVLLHNLYRAKSNILNLNELNVPKTNEYCHIGFVTIWPDPFHAGATFLSIHFLNSYSIVSLKTMYSLMNTHSYASFSVLLHSGTCLML